MASLFNVTFLENVNIDLKTSDEVETGSRFNHNCAQLSRLISKLSSPSPWFDNFEFHKKNHSYFHDIPYVYW